VSYLIYIKSSDDRDEEWKLELLCRFVVNGR